MTKYATMTML